MMEDFGHFGDPSLMEPFEDDLMAFRDAELDADDAAGEYDLDGDEGDAEGDDFVSDYDPREDTIWDSYGDSADLS